MNLELLQQYKFNSTNNQRKFELSLVYSVKKLNFLLKKTE